MGKKLGSKLKDVRFVTHSSKQQRARRPSCNSSNRQQPPQHKPTTKVAARANSSSNSTTMAAIQSPAKTRSTAIRATRILRRATQRPVLAAAGPPRIPSTQTSRSRALRRPPRLHRPLALSAATQVACPHSRRLCRWPTRWPRWATSTLWPASASLRAGSAARRTQRTCRPPRRPRHLTCPEVQPLTRRPTCPDHTAGPEHRVPKGGATERGASYATCSLFCRPAPEPPRLKRRPAV